MAVALKRENLARTAAQVRRILRTQMGWAFSFSRGHPADTAHRIHAAAAAALAEHPRMLVVDLSTAAVDAGVVAELVGIAYQAGTADIGLCLLAQRDGCVCRALEDAGVLDLFEIHGSVRKALGTLRSDGPVEDGRR